MSRLALVLFALAAFAPAAPAQVTTLLGPDAFRFAPLFHDGRVTYLRKTPAGASRLVRLDPATNRTRETALPAPGGTLSYDRILLIAGRLYIQTFDEVSYEAGPLFALDGPAFRPSPVSPALSAIREYRRGLLPSTGARAFAASGGASEPGRLVEVSADGRVMPLEPAPPPGERGVFSATPLGDAVYYVASARQGSGTAFTLWRASAGQAAPADVLPAPASGNVSGLATAGRTLLISTADADTGMGQIFRLAPGAARATPLPGFEAPTRVAVGVFRTIGDVLFFTSPDPAADADSGGRVRLYRQRGDAPPERIPDLDLGAEESFFYDAVREADGALYVASYTPADDAPYGPIRSVFRVGPDGPPRLVVRIEGEGTAPQIAEGESPFVVAGGKIFFVLQTDSGTTLASMPLVGQTPARPRSRRR